MAVVKVPRTPKRSFNKDRKPSALLLDQIRHLEWAVLPAMARTPKVLRAPKARTEAQAAERVAQLTRLVLQASQARGLGEPPPRALPPMPRVPKTSPPRKARPVTSAQPRKTVGRRKTALRGKKSALAGPGRRKQSPR